MLYQILHSFTKIRFCRFPGCELGAISDSWYCSKVHEGKFDAAFPKGSDCDSLLKTVIRAGPTWYCLNETISNRSPQRSNDRMKDYNHTWGKSTPITQKMDFPTELQDALIFKTDIGVIPRSPPKEHHLTSPYSSSANWLRDIKGCYLCGNKSITANYNFCTYRCYLIFYEWCIRRIQTFSGMKMCRDTGCNRIAAEGFDCCNKEHTKAIDEKYSGVRKVDLDRFCTLMGPNFYKKCDVPDIIPKIDTEGKDTQPSNDIDRLSRIIPSWSKEFYSSNEQVSSIKPKGEIKSEVVSQKHTSPYTSKHILTSQSKNSLVSSTPISDVTHLFDSSIEETESNPILPLEVRKEVPECNYDNSNPFKMGVLNQQEVTTEISSGSQRNPFSNNLQKFNELLPFTLSRKLTDLLAQRTDVGIIPRSEYQSAVSSPKYSNNSNWTADIPTCYWCELSNTSFHALTCSRKCWLLFHEWCVRKVGSGCGFRLCVLPGCENSRFTGCSCCSLEHIQRISELRGSLSLSIEEEVELTLGPKWYTDLSPIYFSRTGGFYEFSNYFPSLLLLNGLAWPTVYHYLCAQKLIGTPYGNQISGMECINELERWMKRRTLGKWMRPDWDRICEGATYKAVFTKFEQNKVLKGMLLKTGRRPLVCGDGTLGDMLVSLREWFRTYRYPNQPSTNLPLTPNVAIAIPEIVSKTSPPVTDTESQPQDIVVPKCEHTGSDDSDSNDEVADTIQASFDTDFSDDD